MCRLSMSGQIAIKTSNGYKAYNVKTGRLTNCDNFALNTDNLKAFFVIPTNKVAKGDIILVNGKPKCVITPGKDKIEVINYEDSTVETIVPERHMFMGNTYFYGKIVSMFGDTAGKKNGGQKLMKFMMLNSMMNGKTNSGDGMAAMMPFMMMGGMSGMDEMFDGMLDLNDSEETEEENGEEE